MPRMQGRGGALALLEIGREHGLEHLGECAKDPFTGMATSGSVHSAPSGPTRRRTSGASPMAFRSGQFKNHQVLGPGKYKFWGFSFTQHAYSPPARHMTGTVMFARSAHNPCERPKDGAAAASSSRAGS